MNAFVATATQDNASIVTFVKEHVGDTIDGDLVDFFLLAVVDFAAEEFPISGLDAMKWLDYGRSDNFKRFCKKHLVEDVDYKVLLRAEENPLGGRPAEDFRFTVESFKDLCMLAGTDQGRRVRGYYRALEKVHGEYFKRMHAETRTLLITSAEDARIQREDDVHRALMNGMKGRAVTYLAVVKHLDDGWFIVKVGETDDVDDRSKSLNTQYGRARFVHMLACLRAHKLEQHVRRHPALAQYRDREHFNSIETFKANDDIYNKIKKVMDKEHVVYNTLDREEELEMRRLIVREGELELNKERLVVDAAVADAAVADAATRALDAATRARDTDDRIASRTVAAAHLDAVRVMNRDNPREKHFFEMYKLAHEAYLAIATGERPTVEQPVIVAEDIDQGVADTAVAGESIDEDAASPQVVGFPVPTVRRRFKHWIQQYHPTTLALMNVFEGTNHAVVHIREGAPQNLTDAAREKKVYCSYRWAEVDRDGDPSVPQDIGPSANTKPCRTDRIARLADDLLTVQEVFESQMKAADAKGVTNSAICQMVKKSKPGHESSRWLRWRDVPKPMQDEYLARATLPGKPKRNGRAVVRIDPVTRKDIERYDTAGDVIIRFAIGWDTLREACDGLSKVPVKGFLWRWADA